MKFWFWLNVHVLYQVDIDMIENCAKSSTVMEQEGKVAEQEEWIRNQVAYLNKGIEGDKAKLAQVWKNWSLQRFRETI